MKIHDLLKSSRLIETKTGNVLFGVPSDVLKRINSLGLGIPTVLVEPDIRNINGISQFAPEFPLYYFLFVGGNLFKKRFIILMKDEQSKQEEIKILSQMLIGSDIQHMTKNGVEEETAKQLRAEMDFMALKNSDGSIIRIEELIQFITPDDDKGYFIEENGVRLRINRKGDNRFEIIEDDTNKTVFQLEKELELPIPITYQLSKSYIPPAFGLINLGSRSGFDPDGYTTTMIVSINGVMGLLDGSAYVLQQLSHFGLSFEDIKYIFITHTHDDHCNLSPIAVHTMRRIPVITTRDIYESAVSKTISNLENITEDDFKRQFPLIEVKAGYDKQEAPIILYGAKIYAHRTIHSIPCIGFTIYIKNKSLFFSGDTLSPKKIKEFYSKGVISENRAKYLISKLNHNYTRALIDGGGGLIHGNPDEFKPRRGLHMVHVDPKSIESSLHNLLDAGQNLELISSKSINENLLYRVAKILRTLGIGIFDAWFKVFINAGRLVHSQQYEFLALEGEVDESGLFLVLSGEVEVIKDRKVIAKYGQGTFFGELALLEDKKGKRDAAIRISSITASLWEIPQHIFHSYIKSSRKKEEFYYFRDSLNRIRNVRPFNSLNGEALSFLAPHFREITYEAGKEIPIQRPGEDDALLIDGSIKTIENESSQIIHDTYRVNENNIIINISSLVRQKNCRLIAQTKVKLVLINKNIYSNLLKTHPGLAFTIQSKTRK